MKALGYDIESDECRLQLEMILLHRTEEKEPPPPEATKLKKLVEPREGDHLILNFDEAAMEKSIHLRQRYPGEALLIEIGKRQPKPDPKFLPGEGRVPIVLQNMIGCADHRR